MSSFTHMTSEISPIVMLQKETTTPNFQLNLYAQDDYNLKLHFLIITTDLRGTVSTEKTELEFQYCCPELMHARFFIGSTRV